MKMTFLNFLTEYKFDDILDDPKVQEIVQMIKQDMAKGVDWEHIEADIQSYEDKVGTRLEPEERAGLFRAFEKGTFTK